MCIRDRIKKVKDDVLVHEEEVTFYLGIERIWDVNAANVVRAWLGPSPAHFAGVTYLFEQV